MFFDSVTEPPAKKPNPRERHLWTARVSPAIYLVLAVFISFLCEGSPCGEASEKKGSISTGGEVWEFRWTPTSKGLSVERIVARKKVVVPIEISLTGNIAEVIFIIPSKFRAFGISMEPQVAEVKDGKAHAGVAFFILEGMPLGRHDLIIEVLDGLSRTRIGSVKLPFILLPSDLECLC